MMSKKAIKLIINLREALLVIGALVTFIGVRIELTYGVIGLVILIIAAFIPDLELLAIGKRKRGKR